MRTPRNAPGILLLEDGTSFHGWFAGNVNPSSFGEVCFTTGLTGYQESLSDPSFRNQILVSTAAHLGNYGIHPDESESKTPQIKGYICQQLSSYISRRKPNLTSLPQWLEGHEVPVLWNVDTRALVRHLREKGVMRGWMGRSEQKPDHQDLVRQISNETLTSSLLQEEVSVRQAALFGWENQGPHIVVMDFGCKQNILRQLVQRGARVTLVPWNTTADQIKELAPEGVLLSNGPGDPQSLQSILPEIRKILLTGIPIMGICLGHQVLGMTFGIPTFKMKHGHRGLNHPVLHLETGKGEITSQNHGYALDKTAVEQHPDLVPTHVHLNDGTLAGFQVKDQPVFSVQYHPEAAPGPEDARYLFDTFLENVQQRILQPSK
jgi:carbamoyl-phosphate synthase small subunit